MCRDEGVFSGVPDAQFIVAAVAFMQDAVFSQVPADVMGAAGATALQANTAAVRSTQCDSDGECVLVMR